MYFFVFLYTLFFIAYFEKTLINREYCTVLSKKNRCFVISVFVVIYYIVLSCQYYVGTDYPTYIDLFSGKGASLYFRKKEYGFYYLCMLLKDLKLPPQTGFWCLNLIQFLCILEFLNKIKLNSYKLFMLLYLSVGTFVYNQTNAMRQFTSTSILLLSYICVLEKKYVKSIVLIFFAALFHNSSLLVIAFIPLMKFFTQKRSLRFHVLELFILLGLSTFNLIEPLFRFIPFIGNYSHYLNSVWGTAQVSFVNKISKFVFIPFYLFSLNSFKKLDYKNGSINIFLYQLGYFAFCYRLFSLSNPLFGRFSAYFDFFSIFPLYFFMLDWKKGKLIFTYFNKFFYVLWLCLIVGLLFLKTVLFATGEYDYHSILTQGIF